MEFLNITEKDLLVFYTVLNWIDFRFENKNFSEFKERMCFITYKLFIFAALILSTYSLNQVIIVGGGMSGLSASVKLKGSGITNVIILEASNRLGGRMNTVPFRNNSFLFINRKIE